MSAALAKSGIRRGRLIALIVLAINLLLVGLFPPFDYQSVAHGNVPTFEGFRFYFSNHVNRTVNVNFLSLEVFAVLINFLIAWLLLRDPAANEQRTSNLAQRWVLVGVGVNLVLMVLYPPFENFTAITKAALPTFEGFFFVFGDNSQRLIVTPILYLEVAVLLINGGLLWLYLKDRKPAELTAERKAELARTLQSVQKR